LLGSTDAGVSNATDSYNNQKDSVQSLIDQYTQKGTDQLSQEDAAGIPGLRSTAATLATQYNTQQLAYNAQYNAIFNSPNATMEQKAQQISELQQQHGYDLANTSILQSLAQTNYTNAQNIINHQIDIKYAPMKDAIDFGMQFLSQNKDILTTKQSQSFEANLAVQNQMYTQGQYYDHLLSDTKVSMVQAAVANGATDNVIQGIWNAPSIGQAGEAAASFINGSDYTPTQTGVDDRTGLPIYSVPDKNGQMSPVNPNGTFGTTGSSDTIVNGYQFGASTKMGAYASDTSTQVNNIKTTVAKIGSSVGAITDSQSADAALKVATGGKNSPITGAMVMAAAQQYGVDPATLIGVMQAETQCGTDGSKGAQQCNWGNVGNTDAVMASGGSVKMNPQQGIDAIAKNLQSRAVQSNQTDPSQPAPNSVLTPQQIAQNTVKSAPLLLQPALQTTVGGSVYLDSSKVPSNLSTLGTSYAAKNGIPVLTPAQVAIVNQTSQAMADVINVTGPAWNAIAPTGFSDKLNNFLGHYRASYDGPGGAPTDAYNSNKTYSDNQENLAQQIRALAQAAPEVSLLSTAANALPTNSGYFSPGGAYDAKSTGTQKLQKTLDLLNEAMRTYIPNAPAVNLTDTLSKNGSSVIMSGPQGTYNVPANQVDNFKKNGYTLKQ
jgi:hypothetical protein